mmetsp:Transcript_115651/g.326981  ORF Transcript_115651/g.326981 Transcript_115651/m.326981 type:complete len:155 (+) Transcript_115651:46-510(+)
MPAATQVDGSAVVHDGWIKKRMRHVNIWRSQWMALTEDGKLHCTSSASHLSAAETFVVRQLLSVGNSQQADSPLRVEVEYVSMRNRALQCYNSDIDRHRVRIVEFDADMVDKPKWAELLGNLELLTELRFERRPAPDAEDDLVGWCDNSASARS